MPMRQLLIVSIFILGLLTTASAQAGSGFRAAVNRWPVKGGATSRSRVSLTKVPVEGLNSVWEAESEGSFCGETLVWDDKAIMLERRNDGAYQIAQVELADGQVSARSKRFEARSEPELAIWGRRALVLIPGTGIQGFGLTRSLVTSKWRVSISSEIACPVLVKEDLYLRNGGAIERYKWRQQKPAWSVQNNYIGDFAIADGELYAVRCSGDKAYVDILDLESGRVTGSTEIGEIHARMGGFKAAVQLSAERVLVTVPAYFQHVVGQAANAMLFKRERKNDRSYLHTVTVLKPLEAAILRGDSVLTRTVSDRLNVPAWLHYQGDSVLVMTTDKDRPQLFLNETGALQTRGVCWLGETAFDFRSGRIFRQAGPKNLSRPVPMQGGLLFRTADDRVLCAMRADSQETSPTPEAMSLKTGTFVTRDGQISKGRIEANPKENRISRFDHKDRESKSDFDTVLAVEDEEGRLQYWRSEDAGLRGIQFLREYEQAELALECAKLAKSAKSMFLLDLYIEEATELGIEEKELRSLHKALEGFEKRPPKTNDSRVEELEKFREKEEQRLRERDWNRVLSLGEKNTEMQISLMRVFLSEEPRYAPAQELVRSWLPESLAPKGQFKPADWLDFVLATKRRPIRIVHAPAKGKEGEAGPLEREVGSAEHTWRKGLIGVASEQLLILTPMENPSQIANCLTVGELVTEELERIFGGVRDSRFPLRIHLFATKKAYVDFHARRGQPGVEFSLGNYSPTENISRMFLPGDEDEFNDVLSTFVHELTHHWMAVRCPAISAAQAGKALRRSRGFWVVEGLATMMEEFAYDAQRGHVRHDPLAVDSLDTLANCPKKALLPWDFLILSNHATFARLMERPGPIPGLHVPMTWQLSMNRTPSVVNLFYAQAGALCHYLFLAEEGKYREAFIKFIGQYYADDAVDWTPDAAFGGDPEALGARVQAYAEKRVRPE